MLRCWSIPNKLGTARNNIKARGLKRQCAQKRDQQEPAPSNTLDPTSLSDVTEISTKPRKPLLRSAYRRVVTDDERAALKAAEQERLGRENQTRYRVADAEALEQQITLPKSMQSKLYIIDGYNIINKDPSMALAMDKEPSSARHMLEYKLRPLATPPSSEVLIVYDAMSQVYHRQGNSVATLQPGMTVVFATIEEADTYIISYIEHLHHKGNDKNVFVVTHDNRIKDAALEQDCCPTGIEYLEAELQSIQQARKNSQQMPVVKRVAAPSLHDNSKQWARRVLSQTEASSVVRSNSGGSAAPTPMHKDSKVQSRRKKNSFPRHRCSISDVQQVDLDALLSKKNADLQGIDSFLDGLL